MQIEDIGTVIEIDIGEDVSRFTQAIAKVKKPDGTTTEWTLVQGDTNQLLQYTTQEGDLDQAGLWSVQTYVELPGGKWHGKVDRFRVEANLR